MCTQTEQYRIGKANLSPRSYPTDKGRTKAPRPTKLKTPTASLWQP